MSKFINTELESDLEADLKSGSELIAELIDSMHWLWIFNDVFICVSGFFICVSGFFICVSGFLWLLDLWTFIC